MNQNEIFEKALGYMIYLANESAHSVAYNQDANYWTKEAFKKLKESSGKCEFWKQVFKLDDEYRYKLGFKKWDDVHNGICIPIWIIACLPEDFDCIVTSIFGEQSSIKNIDKDTRFCCVAYMV